MALQVPASLRDANPATLDCSCFDPNCKLKRYFRYHSRLLQQPAQLQQQQQQQQRSEYSVLTDADYQLGLTRERRLLEEDAELAGAHSKVVGAAGGAALCRTVHDCCAGLARRCPEVLTATASEDGDTVLMRLCARRPRLHDDAGAGQSRLLHAQILAFARLYLEEAPEMLFARNAKGTNALELAGLTDKAEVGVFLALLYGALGRDANEASSPGGHTVLHMLARKGDDCLHTLECLLRLKRRRNSEELRPRLFRLDVVNAGRKTPLDVAVTCRSLFSTGPERAVYDGVIAAFHSVIEEEARELFDLGATGATDTRHMTFRNF